VLAVRSCARPRNVAIAAFRGVAIDAKLFARLRIDIIKIHTMPTQKPPPTHT